MSLWLLVLGCFAFGFALDRYPGFYVDDVVFGYPAFQAVIGKPFAYPGSLDAPYVNTLWAIHGPVLPNLDIVLFKVLGFSTAVSRLPDFLGGWAAAFFIALFLKRKGYRYAGLAFAILWCGDRAVQEIMYGRMDGLAMLFVVLAFLCVDSALTTGSAMAMYGCGILCGLAILTHPLCSAFAAAAIFLLAYSAGWNGAIRFAAGGLLNLPLLLALWRFHPLESMTQFFWVAAHQDKVEKLAGALNLFRVLMWSRYWFVTLFLFALACSVVAARTIWKRQKLSWGVDREFVLAATFGFAALVLLFRSTMFPYYIVYFSIWPMLCAVILAERHWRGFRPVAVVMTAIWCSSAAWNFMRVREPVKLYSHLSHHFLRDELKRDVPPNATVITTAELYAIPIEDGFLNRGVTTFAPMGQDVSPDAYLLITEKQFEDGAYIPRANLDRRKTLYAGPAFPGAGPLAFPVVVLSPEGPAPAQGVSFQQ